MGSAAQVLPGRVSWADARHGWIARGGYKCRPAAELCATENGGKSWHGIWLGFGGEIEQYARTSAHAGLFVNRSSVWWTRDNGRHWFQTDLVPGTPWIARTDSIIGQSGLSLVRVRPWPPRGRARCPRRFVNGALPGAKSTFPRNVCVAVVNAGMRIDQLARVRADEGIGTLVPVPRGVAGLASYCLCNVPTFEVFVWRPDRFAETDLSVPEGLVPSNLKIRVAWPDVFVVGQAFPPGASLGPARDVVWHSTDGGRSWTRTMGA